MNFLTNSNSKLLEFWLGMHGVFVSFYALTEVSSYVNVVIYLYILCSFLQIIATLVDHLTIRHTTNWTSLSLASILFLHFGIELLGYLYLMLSLGNLHTSFLTNYLKHLRQKYNVGISFSRKDDSSY